MVMPFLNFEAILVDITNNPTFLYQAQSSILSTSDLKTAAPSAVPVDHLTAEVSRLPFMFSMDTHFPINYDLITLFISGQWPALIC